MTENNMASSFVAVPQAYMFKECRNRVIFQLLDVDSVHTQKQMEKIPLRHYILGLKKKK